MLPTHQNYSQCISLDVLTRDEILGIPNLNHALIHTESMLVLLKKRATFALATYKEKNAN
jgi:hypothetical protein